MRDLLPGGPGGAPEPTLAADLAAMGACVLGPDEIDLCRSAEAALRRARARADRWEAAARARHDAVLGRARRAGREEGLDAAAADLSRLGHGLGALGARVEERARTRALEVVRALFDGLEEEERVAAAARRAAAEHPAIGGGRLAVPPALRNEVAARLAARPGHAAIEVVADPALPRGAARLETPMGAIALSAERQLALAAALLAAAAPPAEADEEAGTAPGPAPGPSPDSTPGAAP